MSLYSMNDTTRRAYQSNGNVEAVRKNYRVALSELTFNSKPIITHLTILAQENQTTAANAIVKEIEGQLRANTAEQKLPVLYLIDSICKNVGGVYLTIFGRTMVNVFLDAYTLTDASAQERMERLLQTWKHGLPGGRPVFPRHIIEPIEKSIRFIREKQAKRFSSNTIHVNPNFINKVNDLRPTIEKRDPRQRTQTAELLAQIQHLLPTEPTSQPAPQPSIEQIVGQIQAILPTLPPHQASSIEHYISQIIASSPSSTPISASTPSVTPFKSSPLIAPAVSSPLVVSATTSPLIAAPAVPPAAPVVAPPVAPVNTADLLKSLTSLGYLEPEHTLDSKALQVRRPRAHDALYSALPLQCKQCGFRYPKTEKGQQKMDAHLDSHFRQNRKLKEKKRGLSRSWFVTVDEWIHGELGESIGQQVPTFLQDSQPAQSKENSAESNPEEHLVVKHTDEKKTCAICGETFVQFWNDDEEEWMFKNALLENEKMYHATCHADTRQDSTSHKRKLEESIEKNKHHRLA